MRTARTAAPFQRQSGVAATELAFILPILLLIIFGLLELSLVIFRYHIVSQAARQIARVAIVHGELAAPELTTWGPSAVTISATSTGEIATAAQPCLTGLDPSQTTIVLEWPDGNTKVESRVSVTVTTQHQPILALIFTSGWTLTAKSVLPIAH